MQEAGRALRLSAKTGAYLFPELARAEASGPQRTAIQIMDEAGTEHAMFFIFKRYTVGCVHDYGCAAQGQAHWSEALGH